jgi:hypothetical protein
MVTTYSRIVGDPGKQGLEGAVRLFRADLDLPACLSDIARSINTKNTSRIGRGYSCKRLAQRVKSPSFKPLYQIDLQQAQRCQ